MRFPKGKKRLTKFNAILCCCTAVWLSATSMSGAQSEQTPGQVERRVHPRLTKSARLSDVTPTLLKSNPVNGALRAKDSKTPAPADAVSQPAKVSLRDGKLTVEANNSDLAQILQNFANISGMNLQGMNTGPRIFGVYGPGSAREVLSDLLAGSGYNFVIVGGSNGSIPHDLLLTAQNDNASTFTPRDSHPAIPPESVEAEPQQAQAPQRSEVASSLAETSATGAFSPVPSRNDQDSETRMQQTLQRLQHLQEPSQEATQ